MTPFTLLVPPAGGHISRVSSRQTRNFSFGQSSQSHLRLRHRPQNTAGALHALVVSGRPGQALSSLPLSLLRSKARGSPSVASPFDGMTVHWTLICFRLTPVPGLDAALRLRPIRARSSSVLGARLDQGVPKKAKQLTPPEWARAGERVLGLTRERPKKQKIFSRPASSRVGQGLRENR